MKSLPAFFAVAAVLAGTQAQSQTTRCEALAQWTGVADDLAIVEARHVEAQVAGGPDGNRELPPHCHVTGSFEHRTGVDNRDYAIAFSVNLPTDWNGRFLFQGGGGLNGALREPLGTQAAGNASALSRGFVVASTDSGHVGTGFDGSFMADQQAMLNFQFQANAKVSEVARSIAESFYGSGPHHSYFVGCSTGGREGMIMAQHYPNLFDGIVSGAPAMRTTVSNLALRWVTNQYAKSGFENTRDPFTDSEDSLIMSSLMGQCDALDGNSDGLIFNRASCDFDPLQLACSTADAGDQCLADHKATALAAAMAGPVTASGIPVYVSFPYDSGIDDLGRLPGLLAAGGSPPVGSNGSDSQPLDIDSLYFSALDSGADLGSTATYYNVASFIMNGGKHIFYHGEADPWFSSNDTVRYFERMDQSNEAVAAIEDYGRLYLVPGMAHCSGGDLTVDSFDLLTPLVEWVENGTPPSGVAATGESMPNESRLLCPHPSYSHFSGSDPASASSYECRLP